MSNILFGKIKGTEISVSRSIFITYFILLIFEILYSETMWKALGISLGKFLILYMSVLIHEVGHAVGAKIYKYDVKSINLSAVGGFTIIHGAAIGKEEFVLIGMGPLFSLLMGLIGWGNYAIWNPYGLSYYLFLMNALLFLSNIIPAVPLDGGKMLRAILCKWFSYLTSTKIAIAVTVMVCIGLVIFGLMSNKFVLFILVGLSIYLMYATKSELEFGKKVQAVLNEN